MDNIQSAAAASQSHHSQNKRQYYKDNSVLDFASLKVKDRRSVSKRNQSQRRGGDSLVTYTISVDKVLLSGDRRDAPTIMTASAALCVDGSRLTTFETTDIHAVRF